MTADLASFTASDTSPSRSGHNPAYVSNVIVALACPNCFCRVFTSAPLAIAMEVYVWRSEWIVRFSSSMPASLSVLYQTRVLQLCKNIGPLRFALNTQAAAFCPLICSRNRGIRNWGIATVRASPDFGAPRICLPLPSSAQVRRILTRCLSRSRSATCNANTSEIRVPTYACHCISRASTSPPTLRAVSASCSTS
jgi:hypothetical protein